MGFRHTIVKWFNRQLLEEYRQGLTDPAAVQSAALERIVARHAGCGWLRQHGVVKASELRRRLPIVGYDELKPYVDPLVEEGNETERPLCVGEPVTMFLKTSGTTGPAKLLPVTAGYEEETDRGRRIWIERMLADDDMHGDGAHLAIISPMHEGSTPSGLPYGSNTGRIFMRQPGLVRAFAPVPYQVFSLRDSGLRYRLIVRFAMARRDVGTFTTANPSTVLLLCRQMLADAESVAEDIAAGRPVPSSWSDRLAAGSFNEMTDRRQALETIAKASKRHDKKRAEEIVAAAREGSEGFLARLWPKLTTVNCWLGGHAPMYMERIRPFLSTPTGSLPVRDPGVSASEGLFAVPIAANTAEAVLHTRGPFMEFVPEGESISGGHTLLAHELEPGRRYRLIATTSGGLWRYDMADIVEVTGLHKATPMIRFLYKADGISSVTGEKVTEGHAVEAARAVGQGFPVEHVCASVQLGDPPGYVVAVEALPGHELDVGAIGPAWDTAMVERNVEYAEKRASGRLAEARAVVVSEGTFGRWRQQKVAAGAPDGQVKLPPLIRDFEVWRRELGVAL